MRGFLPMGDVDTGRQLGSFAAGQGSKNVSGTSSHIIPILLRRIKLLKQRVLLGGTFRHRMQSKNQFIVLRARFGWRWNQMRLYIARRCRGFRVPAVRFRGRILAIIGAPEPLLCPGGTTCENSKGKQFMKRSSHFFSASPFALLLGFCLAAAWYLPPL